MKYNIAYLFVTFNIKLQDFLLFFSRKIEEHHHAKLKEQFKTYIHMRKIFISRYMKMKFFDAYCVSYTFIYLFLFRKIIFLRIYKKIYYLPNKCFFKQKIFMYFKRRLANFKICRLRYFFKIN